MNHFYSLAMKVFSLSVNNPFLLWITNVDLSQRYCYADNHLQMDYLS